MKKTYIFLLASLITLQSSLVAQRKLSIDNIYSVTLKNSGTIVSGDEIKGYFLFYQSDKIDKKTNEYTLRILDENLNIVKDIKFNDSKELTLVEAAFNNSSIMFSFYNREENMSSYRVYNFDGKEIANYARYFDKNVYPKLGEFAMDGNTDQAQNKSLFDINNKGFVSLITTSVGNAKANFEVSFYSTLNKKTWTYTPQDESPKLIASFAGFNKNVVYIQVTRFKNIFSLKATGWLLGFDVATGKKLFETQTSTKNFVFSVTDILNDESDKNTILSGPYFAPDGDIISSKPLGVAFLSISDKGEVSEVKTFNWEKDLPAFTGNTTSEKSANIFIHRLLRINTGEVFMVGEGYETTSLGRLKIRDLFLFRFNPDLSIKKVDLFSKEYSSVQVPSGMLMSSYLKAYSASLYMNCFDFCYLQSDASKSNFTIGYTNYNKSKGAEQFAFNLISFSGGEITTDQITLNSKATFMSLLPAKLGSVMIIEYFKKEKKLDLRLEKVN